MMIPMFMVAFAAQVVPTNILPYESGYFVCKMNDPAGGQFDLTGSIAAADKDLVRAEKSLVSVGMNIDKSDGHPFSGAQTASFQETKYTVSKRVMIDGAFRLYSLQLEVYSDNKITATIDDLYVKMNDQAWARVLGVGVCDVRPNK